jgi:hypothetical protein
MNRMRNHTARSRRGTHAVAMIMAALLLAGILAADWQLRFQFQFLFPK